MHYYIASLFLFLLTVDASGQCMMNRYPAPFLRWIQQIRHIPGMNWLNQTQTSIVNPPCFANALQPAQFPNGYRYQTINRMPIGYGNYCNQLAPFQSRYHYINPVQFYARQPMIPLSYYPISPQQRIVTYQPMQGQSSYMFQPQLQIRRPVYQQYSPYAHQKPRLMMCVPIQSPEEEPDDDFIPEDYDDDIDEHDRKEHKNHHEHEQHVEHSNRHKSEKADNPISDIKVNPKKKKRRRRRKRYRPPKVNKKIGRAMLKGLHVAEDLAASGALGPQMKAAAIAAEAAETLITGAIKGESAAEIMKKTALTAAGAAMGGSMKAQMMSQVAAQAGVPVPAELNSGGAGGGSPMGMAGGGSFKQQMMNQAGQQALGMAMQHVAPNANASQPVQPLPVQPQA